MNNLRNQSFIINEPLVSAGAVLVDEQTKRVVVIKCLTSGEYLLPKGTKEDNETIEETAVREVFEETGYRNRLSSLLAIQVRPDAGGAIGRHKMIYWYYSRLESDLQVNDTQEEWEHFQSEWHSYDSAMDVLTFNDDKRVVTKAFDMMNSTTFAIEHVIDIDKTIKEAKNSIRLMLLHGEYQLEHYEIMIDKQKKNVLLDENGGFYQTNSIGDFSRQKPVSIELSCINERVCLVKQWFVREYHAENYHNALSCSIKNLDENLKRYFKQK